MLCMLRVCVCVSAVYCMLCVCVCVCCVLCALRVVCLLCMLCVLCMLCTLCVVCGGEEWRGDGRVRKNKNPTHSDVGNYLWPWIPNRKSDRFRCLEARHTNEYQELDNAERQPQVSSRSRLDHQP